MLFRTAGVYHGGGINAGGPVIGCTIVSNWSDSYAGGVSGDMCPVMSNCAIVYNTGQATGGGRGATLTTDCLISNNTGYSWGGGLELVLNATIRNSTIVNNYAGAAGGGLRVLYQATITNCIIANNRCANAGAGVYVGYVWNASVSNRYIVDCQISNNLSLGGVGGGGVAIQDTGQMRNCLVHHNTNTAGNGGGIRLINATAWSQFDCGVINCTVADNYSLAEGGGIAASGVSNLVINCVVAGNRSLTNSYPNVFHADSAGANSSNYYHTCAVTTDAYLFAAGQFNITNDPLYAVGSYRLGNGSPCINNGLNQNWMTGARDLDGAPRVRYGFVDMGAYERSHEATIYNFH